MFYWMVDLKWQRTLERCHHPEPCQCDTNIYTSILGDSRGGSYFGVIFLFTNWWRVKLNDENHVQYKIRRSYMNSNSEAGMLMCCCRQRARSGGLPGLVRRLGTGDHPGGNWGNYPPERSSKLKPWLWLQLRPHRIAENWAHKQKKCKGC